MLCTHCGYQNFGKFNANERANMSLRIVTGEQKHIQKIPVNGVTDWRNTNTKQNQNKMLTTQIFLRVRMFETSVSYFISRSVEWSIERPSLVNVCIISKRVLPVHKHNEVCLSVCVCA